MASFIRNPIGGAPGANTFVAAYPVSAVEDRSTETIFKTLGLSVTQGVEAYGREIKKEIEEDLKKQIEERRNAPADVAKGIEDVKAIDVATYEQRKALEEQTKGLDLGGPDPGAVQVLEPYQKTIEKLNRAREVGSLSADAFQLRLENATLKYLDKYPAFAQEIRQARASTISDYAQYFQYEQSIGKAQQKLQDHIQTKLADADIAAQERAIKATEEATKVTSKIFDPRTNTYIDNPNFPAVAVFHQSYQQYLANAEQELAKYGKTTADLSNPAILQDPRFKAVAESLDAKRGSLFEASLASKIETGLIERGYYKEQDPAKRRQIAAAIKQELGVEYSSELRLPNEQGAARVQNSIDSIIALSEKIAAGDTKAQQLKNTLEAVNTAATLTLRQAMGPDAFDRFTASTGIFRGLPDSVAKQLAQSNKDVHKLFYSAASFLVSYNEKGSLIPTAGSDKLVRESTAKPVDPLDKDSATLVLWNVIEQASKDTQGDSPGKLLKALEDFTNDFGKAGSDQDIANKKAIAEALPDLLARPDIVKSYNEFLSTPKGQEVKTKLLELMDKTAFAQYQATFVNSLSSYANTVYATNPTDVDASALRDKIANLKRLGLTGTARTLEERAVLQTPIDGQTATTVYTIPLVGKEFLKFHVANGTAYVTPDESAGPGVKELARRINTSSLAYMNKVAAARAAVSNTTVQAELNQIVNTFGVDQLFAGGTSTKDVVKAVFPKDKSAVPKITNVSFEKLMEEAK